MESTTIRQRVKSEHDELTFGKFKGKSIAQVLLSEPSYILWLHENDIVAFPEDIVIKAEWNVEDEDKGIPSGFYNDYD